MKTLELAQASRPLSEYAEDLRDEIIVLTSNNQPVAAIVSLQHVDDSDLESLSLNSNPQFMAIIQQARQELRNGKKFSLEEMEREFAEER
jgi:PHD/YefM family antitoxin component YafN of YafNO toxin-antitoxin module